jgi:hypothetical protein
MRCGAHPVAQELKRKVKAVGKRDDVTALLLYTKGQQLLDKEQYDKLGDEMRALGIDVGLRGATCTISNTSPELQAVRRTDTSGSSPLISVTRPRLRHSTRGLIPRHHNARANRSTLKYEIYTLYLTPHTLFPTPYMLYMPYMPFKL